MPASPLHDNVDSLIVPDIRPVTNNDYKLTFFLWSENNRHIRPYQRVHKRPNLSVCGYGAMGRINRKPFDDDIERRHVFDAQRWSGMASTRPTPHGRYRREWPIAKHAIEDQEGSVEDG